ncbi:MAG: hypothetical protein ACRC62_19285 [Microcoleus sp.]
MPHFSLQRPLSFPQKLDNNAFKQPKQNAPEIKQKHYCRGRSSRAIETQPRAAVKTKPIVLIETY